MKSPTRKEYARRHAVLCGLHEATEQMVEDATNLLAKYERTDFRKQCLGECEATHDIIESLRNAGGPFKHMTMPVCMLEGLAEHVSQLSASVNEWARQCSKERKVR